MSWFTRALLPVLAVMLPAGTAAPAHADVSPSGWSWPVDPPHRVLRGFDPPAHDWLPGHRGVDLAVPPGAPVRSAGAGTVSFAGVIAGVGVVAVRHRDGLETTYQPVRSAVRRGATVAGGQQLGVAEAGSHCPTTCLHWGLRRGDVYLDPLALLGAGRVRLLPILDGAGPPGGPAPAATGAVAGSSAVTLIWAVQAGLRRRSRKLSRARR